MQKRSQKIQSIQDKKRNMFKEAVAAEEGMRRVREEIVEREARYWQLSDKASGNRMAAEELEEKLRVLQAGPMTAALIRWRSSFFTMGAAHARHRLQVLQEKFFRRFEPPTPPAQMSGREGGEENQEEQEQRAASQQMGPPAPGGRNGGLPAGPVFDPARFRGANGGSGGAGNVETPYDRKRSLS